MLIAEDVAVMRGKLLVVVTECLPDWELMKKSEAGPPPFATIMNRRPDKVRRMLVHGGVGKFMMIPKFQTC